MKSQFNNAELNLRQRLVTQPSLMQASALYGFRYMNVRETFNYRTVSQSPAVAGTNTSTVTQAGNQQTATINQTGSNDASTTDQSNAQNTVLVNQSGQKGSSSLVKQSGTLGSATVTQTDDNTGTKPVSTSSWGLPSPEA